MWDGAAWVFIGGSGGLTTPPPGVTPGTTTEVFSISPSADITLLSSAGFWSYVPIPVLPSVDPMHGWDASSFTFNPKTPGFYQFFTRSYLPTSITQTGHALLKNDNGTWVDNSNMYVTVIADYVAATVAAFLVTSGISFMNGTTDYVRLWAYGDDNIFHVLTPTLPTIDGFLLP
jgi:hypothetical protein